MDGGDDSNVAVQLNGESTNENRMAPTDKSAQSMDQSTDSGDDQAKPDMKMNWSTTSWIFLSWLLQLQDIDHAKI